MTEIIVPDYVTGISSGAFSGCGLLTSMTIPFVGESKTASSGYNKVFGYIFGYTTTTSFSSIVGGATYQYDSNSTYYHYYIPTTLKSVTITGGNILYGALYNCSSLTSVTIGDSVQSIGSYAFQNCSSLTSIEIPNSVTSIGWYAFRDCSSLTSVTIGDSVTSIEFGAFYGCSKLTSVVIGDSVTSIDSFAFEGCNKLTSVNYTGTIDSWVQIEFSDSSSNPLSYAGKLYINNELVTEAKITTATKINSYAFYNCYSLTSVTIGNSVTSIGDYAFSGCSSLKYNVKDNLKYLGNSENPYVYLVGTTSTDIATATIDDNCKFIGDYAFNNCSSLTSIIIPDSVTSIGSSAFSGCSNFESITLPFVGAKAGVTSNDTYQYPFGYIFGTSSYNGGTATTQYYYGGSTSNRTSTTYYIPSTLKSVTITGGNILYGAFYNCSSLTSIEIPDSVTSIGDYAFYWCKSLTSVEIPDSVESIGDYAFYWCTSLTSVNYTGTIDSWVQIEFSDSCSNPLCYAKNLYINNELVTEANITTATKISDYAFRGCSSLTSIEIPDSVTSIGLWK